MHGATAHRGPLSRRDFDRFRHLIHEASGISLGENKDALLAARIQRRMRALSIDDFCDYLEVVEGDGSGAEVCHLIDAVSTNVTSFFREPTHFGYLEEHLRSLRDSGVTEVRMWSAACSTGEEPYSMAMVASEVFAETSVRVRILATDIASDVLDKARSGRYPAEKLTKLPVQYRPLVRQAGDEAQVAQQLKSMVTFARINLSSPPFPMAGPFHVVFCRNVMIYFRPETRAALMKEAERLLAPGGLLFLGHAESSAGMATALKSVAPAVYRKGPMR